MVRTDRNGFERAVDVTDARIPHRAVRALPEPLRLSNANANASHAVVVLCDRLLFLVLSGGSAS